jgi:hypothetical protein
LRQNANLWRLRGIEPKLHLHTCIALLAYFFAYFLIPNAPRGFMTLLVAVLFLGAVQLLSLSVIAEYPGKIFEEVKGRPQFIVKKLLNNHRQPSGETADIRELAHELTGVSGSQVGPWVPRR